MTLDPTTASSLTEEQAIGVARFAVEKRAPGWQAFEVLLRMTGRPVTEMRLCEASRLYLHSNQLYRFTVDPECTSCVGADRHSRPWTNGGK